MTATERLLANAARYAPSFDKNGLPRPPALRVAVLTCMDARIDTHRLLGLDEGDAHVIRNAGGVVTDDVIRSLAVSQRLLGTEEVLVVQHTDCGVLTGSDTSFRTEVEADTGVPPTWAVDVAPDLDANVRSNLARIVASPFVPVKSSVRGFVFDVADGSLREVAPAL